MPWTGSDFPDAMKNLPEEVRNKAIEIANALLEEKHYHKTSDRGQALCQGDDKP